MQYYNVRFFLFGFFKVEIVKMEKEVAFLSSECISQVPEKSDFNSVVSVRLHDVAK